MLNKYHDGILCKPKRTVEMYMYFIKRMLISLLLLHVFVGWRNDCYST